MWKDRTSKLGIDGTCTQIAVELQNVRKDNLAQCLQRNLVLLREITDVDCTFLATLRPDHPVIQDVQFERTALAQCRPEGLHETPLDALPWLNGRLDHLRLSKLPDTAHATREQAAEAERFAALQIGSVLLVAMHVQGRPAGLLGLANTLPRPWDVSQQLLMKLIGTSLATGLERLRIETRLAKLEERNSLAQSSANDGLWDFDVENNEVYFSPRWKSMLGYRDEDLRARPTGAAWCIRMTCRGSRRRCATTLTAEHRISRARTACATAPASGAGWSVAPPPASMITDGCCDW